MLEFKECCDAVIYALAGKECVANNYQMCWHPYRAIGSIYLNALMFPNGLGFLSHILLLFFAGYIITIDSESRLALRKTYSSHSYSSIYSGKINIKKCINHLLIIIGAFGLLQMLFIGLASVNLTDVSAGVLAGIAILSFHRKKLIFSHLLLRLAS